MNSEIYDWSFNQNVKDPEKAPKTLRIVSRWREHASDYEQNSPYLSIISGFYIGKLRAKRLNPNDIEQLS
jgi:hypothetical protein